MREWVNHSDVSHGSYRQSRERGKIGATENARHENARNKSIRPTQENIYKIDAALCGFHISEPRSICLLYFS